MEKERKFESFFFPVLLGVLFFGLIGFLVVSDFRINQKRGDLLEKIDELRKEVEFLEEQNENLQAGIIETESEVYWEGKLREQGYKKTGEEAVVVLPPEEETVSSTATEKNFFGKILEKLGF